MATEETTFLSIEGMHCAGCAERVQRGLEEVEGVTEASVDLESGRATVAGSDYDRGQLVHAVAGAGYKARLESR